MSPLAETPEPPYYAVIFSAVQTDDLDGYGEMVGLMQRLAEAQPGYLGLEGVEDFGMEVTVSYWKDEASIRAWKREVYHLAAQRLGRERWYEGYRVRIARVERAYGFEAPPG